MRPSDARSEVSGRAKFMAHGRDELVLHLFEATALGDVLECDDHAGDAAVLDQWAGGVFNRDERAIGAPEDFIVHADTFLAPHALENGAGDLGIERAIGVAVVDYVMHVAAGELLRTIPERACAGFVDEREAAVEVDAVDAVTDRLQDELALARGQVQSLFRFVLFGDVNAVVEDEGALAMQVHAAAAEGDPPIDAIAAAHGQ